MYTKSFPTKAEAETFAASLVAAGKSPYIEKTTQYIVIWN